jgi:protein-disulfide isomerase
VNRKPEGAGVPAGAPAFFVTRRRDAGVRSLRTVFGCLDRGRRWLTRRARREIGAGTMMQAWGAWVVPGALVLVLVLARAAAAEPGEDLGALGKEVEALKAGQAAIRKELHEIKNQLQGRRPRPRARPAIEPAEVVLSVEGAPFKGDEDAKLTLVEFTDYQCPFCSRHFRQTWPRIEQVYVKTGKVKLVRDLSIESIHPHALKAAEAAHCAAEQGEFWEMHDRLFSNQRVLGRKDLSGHATAPGLDGAAFDECVDSGKGVAAIHRDVADSERAGARGTPIFYIGLTEADSSRTKVVAVIRGARPYAVFQEAIDGLLASAK